MISSAFWGTLADKYGRKSTLIWTSIFLCYFGFLTSFSPSFHWVLFLRFLVGFFIGGVPQVIIYHSTVVKNYYLELSHSRKNHFQFCRFFFLFFFIIFPIFLHFFQACTLYAEYMPTHVRGRAVMTLSFFWALGALFLAFLAWAVMPELGWRYLVGFSVLPLASFVVMSPFILPESPFYLASIGDKKQVEIELAKVSDFLSFFFE